MQRSLRICMFVVLVVLGTTSVFGQLVHNVGAPSGTPYNGTGNINFAVNREGIRELFPAITICHNTPGVGGGPAPAAAATWDLGDVFTIVFGSSGGFNSPTLATTGALSGANLQVTQTTAGGAVAVTATAAMVQPPAVGGNPPGLPLATVTVTVTAAPLAASGVNCVTISNLRFNIGDTGTATAAGPPSDGTTFGVTVTQVQEGAAGAPIAGASALANPIGVLATQMPPAVGVTGTAGVGTAKTTLGTVGATGVANPTGFTTGGSAVNTTNAGINAGGAAAANPSSGPIASTMVVVTQNSGATASGSVSIQQNPIATNATAAGPFTPIAAGGGLFRGFTAAGPDTTTFLNSSGATTGTQAQIIVTQIPAGATVTFPATVSSSSGLTVWNMALVGSGTLSSPGGTVTYATTVNEGTPYSLNGTAGVGASIDIPFTVTAGIGGSSGIARFVIQVGPTAAQGGTPAYNAVNSSSVIPSQAVANIGQFALFRVSPNTSSRTYPYVLVSGAAGLASSYDTGLVLENTGKGTSGSNSGQDGTFTVYMIGSSTTGGTPSAPSVSSLVSTAAGMVNPTSLTSAGALAQGGIWQALASEILSKATPAITGDWRGYVIINANFPGSAGFAFISQFANVNGGATMGYLAN